MKHHRHHQHHRSWQEPGQPQRMGIILMGGLQIGLLVAALWDIRQRRAEDLRGSKAMWTAISFINFIGPIAYFAIGRRPGRGEGVPAVTDAS